MLKVAIDCLGEKNWLKNSSQRWGLKTSNEGDYWKRIEKITETTDSLKPNDYVCNNLLDILYTKQSRIEDEHEHEHKMNTEVKVKFDDDGISDSIVCQNLMNTENNIGHTLTCFDHIDDIEHENDDSHDSIIYETPPASPCPSLNSLDSHDSLYDVLPTDRKNNNHQEFISDIEDEHNDAHVDNFDLERDESDQEIIDDEDDEHGRDDDDDDDDREEEEEEEEQEQEEEMNIYHVYHSKNGHIDICESNFNYSDDYSPKGVRKSPMKKAKTEESRHRLPEGGVKILRDWIRNNIENPYPSEEVKRLLMEQTGFSKKKCMLLVYKC